MYEDWTLLTLNAGYLLNQHSLNMGEKYIGWDHMKYSLNTGFHCKHTVSLKVKRD
jgi:hypothetical protein